ncbi:phosphatase PAP2 family protein [Candidatus Sodalis endolongispinus]|uniref:Phosphatase PAP2 family protein n=1 Tax=Candidatus Sodalis endolongispinus TaxID=2812662 RepID=A0ABS5Y8E7_9GAMM|nr:phosphatase PAP2 family protein [Candidatus Sodalis endolongispinus]MBT9431275.1 phosphatase PAP2 family protein [Candidatus Sodalis endolongispinus]
MALFISWYLPAHHGFWFALDSRIYHAVNHQAVRHPLFADLLAITNHRVFDLCSLLAMGSLYLHYFLHADAAGRHRMLAIALAMIITALVLNQLGHLVPVSHVSPSRYFKATPGVVSIAELTRIPTKEFSSDSFPGDHGMLLMIFAAFMLHYFGRRGFLQAVLIVLFFSTPRILIGAHWFTDVAVGSLSIVLVGLGLWLPGGGCDALVSWLERHLPRATLFNRRHQPHG